MFSVTPHSLSPKCLTCVWGTQAYCVAVLQTDAQGIWRHHSKANTYFALITVSAQDESHRSLPSPSKSDIYDRSFYFAKQICTLTSRHASSPGRRSVLSPSVERQGGVQQGQHPVLGGTVPLTQPI